MADNTDRISLANDVIFTIATQQRTNFVASATVVRGNKRQGFVKHCDIYVSQAAKVDYTAYVSYNSSDYLSIEPRESGGYHGP